MALPSREARKRRRERGQCIHCSQPAEPSRVLCSYHAQLNRESFRKHYQATKQSR